MEDTVGLPDRNSAKTWGGKLLVDRDGAEIGTCTQVFVDDATGLPEWAQADLNGGPAVVPLLDAAEAGDRVRVAVLHAAVAEAPRVDDPMHISEDEEERLYRHYGIHYSREASDSLLPADEQVGTPSVQAEAPPAEPVQPAETPSVQATAQPAEQTAPPTSTVLDEGPPTSTLLDEGPATERRGPSTTLAAGAVGVLAAIAAAVYWWRQRHQLPPTRKELLAARARDASVALAARKDQLSTSAAPLLRTGKERSSVVAQQAAAQARVAAERAAVQARVAAEQATALAAVARSLRITRVAPDADLEGPAVAVAPTSSGRRRLRALGRRRKDS